MALICNETEGVRTCTCGATKLLTEDGKHYYAGESSVAVCIADETLVKAVRETEDTKKNTNVVAFVCNEFDPKLARLSKI
jgi:hypothetical protein